MFEKNNKIESLNRLFNEITQILERIGEDSFDPNTICLRSKISEASRIFYEIKEGQPQLPRQLKELFSGKAKQISIQFDNIIRERQDSLSLISEQLKSLQNTKKLAGIYR